MTTDTNDNDEKDDVSRRRFLTTAATAAAMGAAGFYAGSESAAADPQSVYPVETEDPLLKLRADRIVLVERTSDPSSPSDGTMWFNGSA